MQPLKAVLGLHLSKPCQAKAQLLQKGANLVNLQDQTMGYHSQHRYHPMPRSPVNASKLDSTTCEMRLHLQIASGTPRWSLAHVHRSAPLSHSIGHLIPPLPPM